MALLFSSSVSSVSSVQNQPLWMRPVLLSRIRLLLMRSALLLASMYILLCRCFCRSSLLAAISNVANRQPITPQRGAVQPVRQQSYYQQQSQRGQQPSYQGQPQSQRGQPQSHRGQQPQNQPSRPPVRTVSQPDYAYEEDYQEYNSADYFSPSGPSNRPLASLGETAGTAPGGGRRPAQAAQGGGFQYPNAAGYYPQQYPNYPGYPGYYPGYYYNYPAPSAGQ